MCRSNRSRCLWHSRRTASPRVATLPAVDVPQALVLRRHELVFTGVAHPVDPEHELKHILVEVDRDLDVVQTVGLLIFSTVITPPDIISQITTTLLFVFIYEIIIGIVILNMSILKTNKI